jgi:hypothetical protein
MSQNTPFYKLKITSNIEINGCPGLTMVQIFEVETALVEKPESSGLIKDLSGFYE